MRRGQITVFVLLGILLLIVVGFAIYTMVVTADENRVSAEDITSEDEAVTQLNQYLQSCVESGAANATRTVLMQGGAHYTNGSDEANTSEYSPSGTPRFFDVYHGISDEYPCSKAFSDPPRYPANGTFFSNYDSYQEGLACLSGPPYDPKTVRYFAGYLGVATIPESCPSNSENQDLPSYVTSRCSSTSPDQDALETHLENATEQAIRRCADNTTVSNRTGNHIELTGEPDVQVGYGTNTTSYTVFLPISVDVSGGEPTLKRHSYTYQSNYPLFSMWGSIHNAMVNEVRDPLYNLSEQLTSLNVQTSSDPNKPLIYEITHPEVDIQGDDLKVLTAAERRAPVLNKISQAEEQHVDVIVEATQDFQLNPEAVDPDDQFNPSITYSGFGEDHTASDDTGRALPDQSVSDFNTADFPEATITDPSNTLKQRTGTHTVKDPYSWGKYTTEVRASIPGDEDDWQDVTTLVVDKPRLTINVSTPTNNGFFIAEAPFAINGSNSAPPKAFGYRPFYNTDWSLQGSPVAGHDINGFTLSDLTSYTPNNIKTKLSNVGITPGTANTTLTSSADTRYLDDVRHDVRNKTDVKRCRATGGSGDPYPYNGGNSPYTTENPCCIEQGRLNKIADTGQQCYSDQTDTDAATALGWLSDQETTANQVPSGDGSAFTSAENELDDYNDSSNVRVTLTRNCGGDRGNLCGGDVNINVINESS
jgi:hypothetical protein